MSEMQHRSGPDIGGALVALIFTGVGLYAVISSLQMTMLGAIFPRTVGGVLIALSMIQILRALTGRGGQASGEGGDASAEGMGRRLVLVAVMLGWSLLFPVIGFVVTSVAAATILLFVAEHEHPGPRGTILRLLAMVAMVGVFYWLMVYVLYIPMPRALLF